MIGGRGNDILFGNTTSFDNDAATLLTILDVWTDDDTDTNTKRSVLEGTYFTPANVTNDHRFDLLMDRLGDNWFPSPFRRDRLVMRRR